MRFWLRCILSNRLGTREVRRRRTRQLLSLRRTVELIQTVMREKAGDDEKCRSIQRQLGEIKDQDAYELEGSIGVPKAAVL